MMKSIRIKYSGSPKIIFYDLIRTNSGLYEGHNWERLKGDLFIVKKSLFTKVLVEILYSDGKLLSKKFGYFNKGGICLLKDYKKLIKLIPSTKGSNPYICNKNLPREYI